VSQDETRQPGGEILVYTAEDGSSRIRVLLEDETVWLTQAMIAELYLTTPQNITLHIRAIYKEGELSPEATCKQSLQVRNEGNRTVRRRLKHYNLDMIIAVGYRVRSPRGTQFRQWATERLREYLVKGFTMDDERLKGGSGLTDYFDELLARIREIRASEARVYQRIRDIFALASDYVEDEQETQRFFAIAQNKMHHAATGLTAAEIIRERADAAQPNMGLTAWKGGHESGIRRRGSLRRGRTAHRGYGEASTRSQRKADAKSKAEETQTMTTHTTPNQAKVDHKIPLNRHFYIYEPPRPLEEIESDIKTLEGEILGLLAEVTR